MTNDLVAAIDCGTNTTRLLITGRDGDVVRRAEITGLGRGLGATGRLDSEAIGRVTAVLASYRADLDRHGVTRCRVAATSAARDAANGAEFLAEVKAVLGYEPEILSGADEAALGFAGATAGMRRAGSSYQGSVLVIDIGGGSTEFSLGRIVDSTPELLGALSVDMGSVRFTELFVEHDPPRPEELSGMLQVIASHLDDVERDLPGVMSASRVIAVAGTATTMAAVEIGLIDYDPAQIDGFVLERAAAEDVFRTLATEPLDDRIHNPGLQRERADVIVAGAAIMVGIMRFLGLDEVIVSERDILDGLADSLVSPSGPLGA